MNEYVWYWQLTESQYNSFCIFYRAATGNDPEGFVDINQNGIYYKVQGDPNYELLLLEWDDEDGPNGEQTFISSYWTRSQVPGIMWP